MGQHGEGVGPGQRTPIGCSHAAAVGSFSDARYPTTSAVEPIESPLVPENQPSPVAERLELLRVPVFPL